MTSPYREIAEDVIRQAAEENALPAVRVPVTDVEDLRRELEAVLSERGLAGEYTVDVRGELVAVIPAG